MMTVFLYNLAFAVFGIFYLPVFLVKIKQAEDPKRLWRERWGILPEDWKARLGSRRTVWLHAVSVGEVNAVEKFIAEWFDQNGDFDLVLTTVTPTGQRIARKLSGPRVHVAYLPFDITFAVRRFFDIIRPEAVILAETEIWPNLLSEAKRRNVPAGVVNGRLSERSFGRYRAVSFLMKRVWRNVDFVLAQTEEDAARFRRLGVRPEAVRAMGNMKFDQLEGSYQGIALPNLLRQRFGLGRTDLVFLAGSTHPGEEELLGEVFAEVRGRFPSLKMIVAPRHIERSPKVSETLKRFGRRVAFSAQKPSEGSFDILVVDELGILKDIFQIADLVFMGGSFVPHGGQSPIEAARFKRAVMHGPNTFNFNMIYRELDQGGGAFCVKDPGDLKVLSEKFLTEPALYRDAGVKAHEIVNLLRGASKRQAEWVLAFLGSREAAERNKVDGKSKELFQAGCGGKMS
ncbi:MAG: 3-deoxy-D-manno-octulosonic acid transferase [Candidatus Omnitrophica bacterium ADurb.Bin277]|nr:MAG: 3-deoxy-D-manno-octulosonic acid transferase [Candidatus Omnitrophica bacterium ADurb.Bin277]